MQTHNDRTPILGQAAEEFAQADKDAVERDHRAKALRAAQAEADAQQAPEFVQALRPALRVANGGRVSDLVLRLIHRQDKRQAERDLTPVRRTIREQVKALVQGFTGPAPVAERNRQAYVDAIATSRNHLGQVRHVYGGTVDPRTVAHRRARNRMARKTRQAQRRARG